MPSVKTKVEMEVLKELEESKKEVPSTCPLSPQEQAEQKKQSEQPQKPQGGEARREMHRVREARRQETIQGLKELEKLVMATMPSTVDLALKDVFGNHKIWPSALHWDLRGASYEWFCKMVDRKIRCGVFKCYNEMARIFCHYSYIVKRNFSSLCIFCIFYWIEHVGIWRCKIRG